MMKKWEYLVETKVKVSRLTELGEEGWELIIAIDINRKDILGKAQLIFKREKIEKAIPDKGD